MPILALHGFTGRGSDFAPFAELIDDEWQCPDLPGHGPNPQLDCTPEATVHLIEEAHSRFNVQRSTSNILLGYSMGARAALQHAVTHPDAWDALVLISPNPGIEDVSERAARRATDAKLAERIEHEGAATFIDFWQKTPMIRSQQAIRSEWRARMQTARAEHIAKGLANSLRQFGQGNCPNLWPKLSKLNIPTCLITGETDYKYTAIVTRMISQLQANYPPLLKHFVIDGVGHMPHLEAPENTAEVIRQFINTNNLITR